MTYSFHNEYFILTINKITVYSVKWVSQILLPLSSPHQLYKIVFQCCLHSLFLLEPLSSRKSQLLLFQPLEFSKAKKKKKRKKMPSDFFHHDNLLVFLQQHRLISFTSLHDSATLAVVQSSSDGFDSGMYWQQDQMWTFNSISWWQSTAASSHSEW